MVFSLSLFLLINLAKRMLRFTVDQVEMGVNYAVVITTKAGLYRYAIGDTVKFVCNLPYRVIVSGRTKHFISAFGEHVIGEEVESSIAEVSENHNAVVRDFHLAPEVAPKKGSSISRMVCRV